MPTPEQQQPNQPAEGASPLPDSTPAAQEQAEQHFKTIAVRVPETKHSQLSFIAQLSGTSISEEIRQAIDGRIAAAQDDPDLIARAQQAREQIEREAATRTAAIAGFMGQAATASPTASHTPASPRTRRTSKTRTE